MNEKLKKYWNVIIKQFKQNYDYLENIDFNLREGYEDELIEKLKNKTGQSHEEILYQIYIYMDKIEKEE